MYKKADNGCQIPDLIQVYLDTFGFITGGRLVEIGAFNCYNWSNSYCLIEAGWAGLMVEPQPDRFGECEALYRDNSRIVLERCCIGKENGEARLYLGGSNSTIRPEMIDIYNNTEWAKFSGLQADKFIECELHTLDYLLKKHDWPAGFELLIVDVEGAELDVLGGFSIDYYRPRLVIIEAHEQLPDEALSQKAIGINAYFAAAGYSKIYSDHINNVYRTE